MADTTPLSLVIAQYLDQQLLNAIAEEYQKRRLLIIGTIDLDSQRPVIWNIRAIAARGRPGSLELVRKIMRASAAILRTGRSPLGPGTSRHAASST